MVVKDTRWSDKKLDLFLKEHPLIRKNMSAKPCNRPQSVKDLPLSKWCHVCDFNHAYKTKTYVIKIISYGTNQLLDYLTHKQFDRWCRDMRFVKKIITPIRKTSQRGFTPLKKRI